MENEENRGLIHKTASENQSVTFFQLSFGALSLFSLSLSLTLGHLDISWRNFGIGSRKENKAIGRKEQARKSEIKQL